MVAEASRTSALTLTSRGLAWTRLFPAHRTQSLLKSPGSGGTKATAAGLIYSVSKSFICGSSCAFLTRRLLPPHAPTRREDWRFRQEGGAASASGCASGASRRCRAFEDLAGQRPKQPRTTRGGAGGRRPSWGRRREAVSCTTVSTWIPGYSFFKYKRDLSPCSGVLPWRRSLADRGVVRAAAGRIWHRSF